MDLLAVLVCYNVTTSSSGVSSDNYTTLEDYATNRGASFGCLWHLEVGFLGQKGISKEKGYFEILKKFDRSVNFLPFNIVELKT